MCMYLFTVLLEFQGVKLYIPCEKYWQSTRKGIKCMENKCNLYSQNVILEDEESLRPHEYYISNM